MSAIYVLLILPKYVQFSETAVQILYGRDVVFSESMFDGWWVMSLLRVVLFVGNVINIAMSINVMRKLVRCLEEVEVKK